MKAQQTLQMLHQYKKLLATLTVILSLPLIANATILYVSTTGAGLTNGSSWANAFSEFQLQFAINSAISGDSIFVSCGVYRPTSGTNRSISFAMRNNIKIFGSFQGFENQPGERAFSCGPCTILSGNINNATISTDNSYKVILNRNLNNSALLDGFVIRDGYDQRNPASIEMGLGAGIYNGGSGAMPGSEGSLCSPTIRNCVIQNNYAAFGAGIFNNGHQNGNASPILDNCIIFNNTASISGGGIDNFGWINGNASPTLNNCLVVNNFASLRAGGMYCWGGLGGNANAVLNNCTFANNHAVSLAGGIIADNSDNLDGSPPFSGNANIVLKNSILWGNTAPQGPQFYLNGGSVSATYSNIDMANQSAPHQLTGSTLGNILSYPAFLDSTSIMGLDNCLMTNDDGFALNITSIGINAGIDGDTISIDLSQNNRVIGLSVDLGPYEYVLSDTCVWTGNANQSWELAQNWMPERIPDADQMVRIPNSALAPNQPVIHNLHVICRKLWNFGIVQLSGFSTLTLKE